MTANRNLQPPFDRANYSWPRVTVIHEDRGSYQLDVHCVRNLETGAMVLIAFQNTKSNEQVEPITESDISTDVAAQLAAAAHAHPGKRVGVLQVERPR